MTSLRRCLYAAVVLLLVPYLVGADAARADDEDAKSIVALRAADLEARGKCDDALALYRRAQDSGKMSADLALIAGRCELRGLHYAEALAPLRQASRLDPTNPEPDLQLGVANFHLDDMEAAERSFEAARSKGAEGPLLDLYTGLLQLHRDDARAAALSLERARRADARAVEPVASYYSFLAWRSLHEEARAREALDRLRETDPDGPWVAEAEKILAQRPPQRGPRVWAAVEAGLEYDSNVVLRGSDVAGDAVGVSDKDDGRGVWGLDAGVELFRTENWSGGVLGAYVGSAHFHLSEFDTNYPTASAWVDRRLGEQTTMRFRYDYGYAWVDYESYLSAHRGSISLLHGWDRWGTTEWIATGYSDNFKYDVSPPPAGAMCQDVNRDADGVSGEMLHRYETGWNGLELRGGYKYTHNSSNGCEYDFDAHRFLVGANVMLPFDIEADGWGSFTYQPFDHQSAYLRTAAVYPTETNPEDPTKRRDRAWQTGVRFERPIFGAVSVIARYTYTDSGSNTRVYDYDRHIVGGYLRYEFE